MAVERLADYLWKFRVTLWQYDRVVADQQFPQFQLCWRPTVVRPPHSSTAAESGIEVQ